MWRNWSFPSSAIPGGLGLKNTYTNPNTSSADCSDDEGSLCSSSEEGLECLICWESFNIVENVPYVLWCGHTLCKNCILGIQWATVTFPSAPVQLPLFISYPWCNLLSFRFVYIGALKFPRKNFFLLLMVESMNRDRMVSRPSRGDYKLAWSSAGNRFQHNHIIRGVPSVHLEHAHQTPKHENQQGSYL